MYTHTQTLHCMGICRSIIFLLMSHWLPTSVVSHIDCSLALCRLHHTGAAEYADGQLCDVCVCVCATAGRARRWSGGGLSSQHLDLAMGSPAISETDQDNSHSPRVS